MKSERLSASITGILFIVGTASGIMYAVLTSTVLNSSEYLSKIGSNTVQYTIASLLLFIMGASCAGIGLSMYPVLMKFNPGLAAGSAGFRLTEGILAMIGFVIMLSIMSLGMKYIQAEPLNKQYFQITGDMLQSVRRWLSVASLYAWCIGALMYYWIFFKTRLVPYWLSLWGITAILLSVIADSLDLFQAFDAFSPVNSVLNLPIAIQEMIFAVWLIAKGYDKSVLQR
jgi:hypothetical protein